MRSRPLKLSQLNYKLGIGIVVGSILNVSHSCASRCYSVCPWWVNTMPLAHVCVTGTQQPH